MKYGEAMDWCEQFTDNLIAVNVDTNRRTLGLQAMQKCKEALKKQIPKEHHHTRVKDVVDRVRESVCPSCLGIIVTREEEYPKHCTWCGQAIDWSK
jgi:hypothetical protein